MGIGNYEKDLKPERLAFALKRWRAPVEGVGGFCVISPHAQIGTGTQIGHHVVIHGNVKIGSNCIIKDHAVIGAPGFSFAHDEAGIPVRIHHEGGVVIGDSCEVGSFTTVCSGTINPTILEDHVKLDDHVHVAHNVKIGARTCIVAGSVIGGGTVIEPDCWIGINASIRQKLNLGHRCLVGMGAVITKDVSDRAVVVGNPGRTVRYA